MSHEEILQMCQNERECECMNLHVRLDYADKEMWFQLLIFHI